MKKIYVVIKQTVMEGVDMLHVEMMSENLEDCKKYLDDLAEQNDGKCGIQRYSDSADSYDTLVFPAHAGLNLCSLYADITRSSIPRACGVEDEPKNYEKSEKYYTGYLHKN